MDNPLLAREGLPDFAAIRAGHVEPAVRDIIGRHRSTGITRPKMWDRARYFREDAALAQALESAAQVAA